MDLGDGFPVTPLANPEATRSVRLFMAARRGSSTCALRIVATGDFSPLEGRGVRLEV
jgi:hypothetical protein